MKRRIDAGPEENISEAWNYKVSREDDVLFNIIPQYQPGFDGNSAEAWKLRFDNGSYHLKLWLDGDSVLPLDNKTMREYFPNKEDREFVYEQEIWIPPSMYELDLSLWKGGISSFEDLRNNMDLIIGTKKINNLSHSNLRGRILDVYNDHNLSSYPHLVGAGPDYIIGNNAWVRQTGEGIPPWFINCGTEYGNEFVPVLENNWKGFSLIKLAYGLGMFDMGQGNGEKAEQLDSAVTMIYTKALGGATSCITAKYPESAGTTSEHQVLGISVPNYILQLLPQDKLVFKGQTICTYSAIDGVKKDEIPYIRAPNSAEIVWRNQ